MAIFSKRILQEMLNQNAHFLSKKQLREHVNKLNKGGIDYLPTEWEVVILNAFSKIGYVRHEQPFRKRLPDLFFQSKNEPSVSFLADITTVSDKGYERENPVKAFIDEAKRILKENGIKLNGFHYEIGSVKDKRAMRLKIPPKEHFDTFFNGFEFKNFTSRILESPASQHALHSVSKEIEVRFFYNPQSKYISGHHASYNTAHSITKNPLYYALEDKAQQLEETGYSGILAIFICDGGCNLLTSSLHDWQSYNLNAVINEFFRQYSSIHFVLVFSVKETPYNFLEIKQKKYIEVKIFLNPIPLKSSDDLLNLLNKFVVHLPTPVNTPINAAYKISNRAEKQGNSFCGGSMITNKTIKISSRGLLELLSGRIKQDKFLQDHCFAPTPERPDDHNPFDLKLNEGKLITDVKLEKSSDKDDDWITFEFGVSDPAISKYKIK